MYSDPIADFLTRVRNAAKAGHKIVEIPGSKMKEEITRILKEQGYILNYKVENNGPQSTLKIALKYQGESKIAAFRTLERASRPGLRKYSGSTDIPRVKNGLGVAILSTSHGVMTDKEARAQNVGGEVLCYVF